MYRNNNHQNSIKMYNYQAPTPTSLRVNNTYVGETLEEKIRRIVENKEPIKDNAPLIYTDRSEGVKAQYDVRTDRFEIAVDAMDKVDKANKAKREERAKLKEGKKVDKDPNTTKKTAEPRQYKRLNIQSITKKTPAVRMYSILSRISVTL